MITVFALQERLFHEQSVRQLIPESKHTLDFQCLQLCKLDAEWELSVCLPACLISGAVEQIFMKFDFATLHLKLLEELSFGCMFPV